MTTKQKWIGGVVLGLFVIFIIMAFRSDKVKNFITPPNPNQADIDALTAMLGHVPTGAELNCDSKNPGYNKDGVLDGFCGRPYSAACDPNKPGFDINGLPNVNCGFGGRKSR